MKIKLHLRGTVPLLMHSNKGIDPLHPLNKEIAALTGIRKKTDEIHEQIAWLKFNLNMDFHDVLGPYLPGANVEASMIEGAKQTKQGKQVQRALFVTDFEVPVIYDGPRTIKEMWDYRDGAEYPFRSSLPVKIGTSRVMQMRPKFDNWSIEAEGELDDEILNFDELRRIASSAGRFGALGDFRPRYGRYEAQIDVI